MSVILDYPKWAIIFYLQRVITPKRYFQIAQEDSKARIWTNNSMVLSLKFVHLEAISRCFNLIRNFRIY